MAMLKKIPKWERKRLKELSIQFIDGDRGKNYPKTTEFVEDGILFLNSTCLIDGILELRHANYISEEKYLQIKKGRLQPLDLVLTMRGNGLGKLALFDCGLSRGLINAQMLILRANSDQLDPRFLFQLMRTPQFQQKLWNFATGSAQPQMSLTNLKDIEVSVPDIEYQRHIGIIGSNFDAMITTIMRKIELLDHFCEILYRHWFVDSTAAAMPSGWSQCTLADACEIVMGQSPSSEFYNVSGDGLPFHQGVTNFGTHFPKVETYCTREMRLAERMDVLFSVRAPVGRINLASEKMVIGRGLSAIRSRSKHQFFTFYQLKQRFQEEDTMGGGTIFKAVTKDDMHKIPFLLPPRDIMDRYEHLAAMAVSQIEVLTNSLATLRSARELLVSRLLYDPSSVAIKLTDAVGVFA